MKKNKGLKYGLCGLMLTVGCFTLGACADVVTIRTIEKTNTSGLVDTYTIYYSDGSTYEFQITNGTNGTNGKDAKDVTIKDIYDEYVKEYGDITFEDFVDKYIDYAIADNSLAINSSLRSCLQIYSEFTVTDKRYPYLTTNKGIACSGGSGVVYRMDDDYTYIITNYHVIYSSSANGDCEDGIAYRITGYLYGSEGTASETGTKDDNGYIVYDYGDTAIPLEYIGGSIDYDIAILRTSTSTITAINEGVVPIEFASTYHVGDTAIAIGNPEDYGISVSEGIIGVDNEFITLSIDGTERSYRSIRIDTAIYEGSSGGGLFNARGELIGITNAGSTSDENINYAIPVSIVKPVVENIMTYYTGTRTTVHKISFGVTVTCSNTKYEYDKISGYGKITEDVVVKGVSSGSIASALALQEDDIITSVKVNDTSYSIDRYFELGDIALTIRSGDKVSFKYIRNGEELYTAEYNIKNDDIKSL